MSFRSVAMDDLRWGRPLSAEAISLDPEELRQAAAVLVPGEESEQAWIRYLRALALLALRRWLKLRGASVLVGPELEPEAPERLIAIQGLATQLLCVSSLAEEVLVPLGPWSQEATAPQLALLAQVDEENGVVEFPGVIDAAGLITEIQKNRSADPEAIELPVRLFNGGLERLLRWVKLLDPEVLPRAGLATSNSEGADDLLASLQQWLAQLLSSPTLIPLPVLGTRGGSVPVLRLITPQVQRAEDGSAFAEPVCSTPTIWADAPLAEVVIVNDGKVVWQQLAKRHNPIDGPIAWPLVALQPGQEITIRLRPWGAPGGAYAVLRLTAAESAALQNREEAIRRLLNENQETDQRTRAMSCADDRAVTSEVRARLWLAHRKKKRGE
jgi:hypothetical protein